MIQFLRSLFAQVTSDDSLARLRGRFVQAVAVIGAVTSAIGVAAQIQAESSLWGIMFTASYIGISAVIFWLVTRRRITLAGTITIAIFLVAALVVPSSFLLLALLAIISAAALAARPLYLLTLALIMGRYGTNLAQLSAGASGLDSLADEIPSGLVIILVSITVRYFIVNTERTLQKARRGSALLQATAEVGQIATTILELQDLFERSVNLIQERFGFYHVQVYIVRDDMAELVASTGEAGQQLLARQHQLEVGSSSVIGRVTRYGEAVIANDADSDAVHRRNPLLPDTRAELAVPILDGDNTIGALDMQSVQLGAFQPEDVQALQSMANLLSAAVRNARLFEAQQEILYEQQHLYEESEVNLSEIQRLNRQLTRIGWDEYIEHAPDATGVTLRNNQIIPNAAWSDHLIEATRKGEIVSHSANGRPGVVAVPVLLRGEVIGAIEVETDNSATQQETIEMIQAVAQRLATSLDNARLFEEAQAATVQEQRINTIVARFQSATSIDDLLRITLAELSEALGAQHGAIRLGTLPDEETNGDAAL